jgi:hypothetical protein
MAKRLLKNLKAILRETIIKLFLVQKNSIKQKVIDIAKICFGSEKPYKELYRKNASKWLYSRNN